MPAQLVKPQQRALALSYALGLRKSEFNYAVGGRRFRYLLYVDFMGNLADDVCQNALRHLQEVTDFMRVLGCYPAHKDSTTGLSPEACAPE